MSLYKIQYHYWQSDRDNIYDYQFEADRFENDGTYLKFYDVNGNFLFMYNNKYVQDLRVIG